MPWGFFESDADRRLRELQGRAVSALKLGKITPAARLRLKRHRGLMETSGFFTTDLTAGEHLLAREAGYESVGVVTGMAVYRLRPFGGSLSWSIYTATDREMTRAQNEVRYRALSRLQQEAALLGAHGVIGVRVRVRKLGLTGQTLVYSVVGTAIRVADRPDDPKPFTSDLSGQQFWALHQAGYWPVGLIYGIHCQYVRASQWTQQLEKRSSTWSGSFNQEVSQFTAAIEEGKNRAMELLYAEGQALGAEYTVSGEAYCMMEAIKAGDDAHNLYITFFTKGTAIATDPVPRSSPPPRPLLMLDLASGKKTTLDSNRDTTRIDLQ